MAQILVLYPNPPDIGAFEQHYFNVHAPLALKIPGLRRLEVSMGSINSPQGPSPWHLVAQLNFDSVAAIHDALGSEESRKASADLANFAPEGRRSFVFDTVTL